MNTTDTNPMKEYKLRDKSPRPTPEELEVLRVFAQAKLAERTAAEMKDTVLEIVTRCGGSIEISREDGTPLALLNLGKTTRYPAPTLEAFDARIDSVVAAPAEDGDEAIKAGILEQMRRYREHLANYLATSKTLAEWEDYLRANGVIRAVSSPMVKCKAVRKLNPLARPEA